MNTKPEEGDLAAASESRSCVSDRRLLELAALAAGGRVIETGDVFERPFAEFDQKMLLWNPLIDDADAFRLAAKLFVLAGAGECECCAEAHYPGSLEPVRVRFAEGWADREASDLVAATRRAIVRAAAEIGRRTLSHAGASHKAAQPNENGASA